MPILKLDGHDEERELAFTVSCYKKMTSAQLFHMMFERNKYIWEMLKAYGHSRPPQIIKRK